MRGRDHQSSRRARRTLLFQVIVPFLREWTRLPEDYQDIYQQMLHQMQQLDFAATMRLLTAWGTRSPTFSR